VAKLEDLGAAFEHGFGGGDGIEVEATERGGVDDGVDAGESEFGQGPI